MSNGRRESMSEIQTIIKSGGMGLQNLLEFAVMSQNFDFLFVHLVGEFRLRPSVVSAVTLYEIFCAPEAQMRISCDALIPPKDIRLSHHVRPLQLALEDSRDRAELANANDSSEPDSATPPSVMVPPPKYLFDSQVQCLTVDESARYSAILQYDASLTPAENLPGGEISRGQRNFIEFVWHPQIRPRLSDAGFWKMAAIC